jgi:heme-degrading monooxygenase HmoA
VARLDDAGAGRHLRRPAPIRDLPRILAKKLPGFLRIELFRRDKEAETEFMTVMWFASREAVTAFVGEDHGVAYVPASARKILARFDERAEHYEVRASRDAPPADAA